MKRRLTDYQERRVAEIAWSIVVQNPNDKTLRIEGIINAMRTTADDFIENP